MFEFCTTITITVTIIDLIVQLPKVSNGATDSLMKKLSPFTFLNFKYGINDYKNNRNCEDSTWEELLGWNTHLGLFADSVRYIRFGSSTGCTETSCFLNPFRRSLEV